MAPRSAGILLFRRDRGPTEVLFVHPGGPFYRNKDAGVWQIPKGLIEPDEDAAQAARRETEEELGVRLDGAPWPLAIIKQAGGIGFIRRCSLCDAVSRHIVGEPGLEAGLVGGGPELPVDDRKEFSKPMGRHEDIMRVEFVRRVAGLH